jgi:hypothetical protein
MLVVVCKLAVAAVLLIAHLARSTQSPPSGTRLFDLIIQQQGHLALGKLQSVNFMSHDQVEVALSMLFFHKYLNPKQDNPLNDTVFQKALLDNLYKLWQECEPKKPSESDPSRPPGPEPSKSLEPEQLSSTASTSALQELVFASCQLMQYLRTPLLKDDSRYFSNDLDKYQSVHVRKATRGIMPELHDTEDGWLFINSLIDFLPAMTVGYGLLVGDFKYWKNAQDAKMARIFMFAFLNLDFAAVEEYVSADNALELLNNEGKLLNKDKWWPKLFDASQYEDLGKVVLSKREAKGSNKKRKRIVRMKRRQQLYNKLTGMNVTYGSKLTTIPFRSLSLICKQPLMLKKIAMTQGQVYRNMSCLLQAGDPDSRANSLRENILVDLIEIAKSEGLMSEECFTVSSLYIRHTKEFLPDRSFVLCQDFHALPLKLQNTLLSETRPSGIQPDEDTPTSIIASVQNFLDFFQNACKQVFTATELESADKLDWFVLDVVCPGGRYDYVLLQGSQYPGPLPSQDESTNIPPRDQYHQVLWGANKSLPNNRQYAGIAHIDKLATTPRAELLIIPTDDANDMSQTSAILIVQSYSTLNIATIWWDPKYKLVRLQKMSLDNTVCQVTIPQHLILDDCTQEYGLEHRMIIVLSEYSLPTLEEAAQMLTMKDRQLHDLKDQEYYSQRWSIITVKPKCLAKQEYAPDFPQPRSNRLLAIVSEFSDLQKLNPMRGPGDVFTPSEFLVRIGKKLLESVLMTAQSNSEVSRAAWLAALEDLEANQVVLLGEKVEQSSKETIVSYLSEHHWTYNQLIKGEYDVAGLPAVVRFLWHQHRLMIACMLGCTHDALNWDTSLASNLMALSMSDLVRDISDDTMHGLISFFEQGFWDAASSPKKQEWIQVMQCIHPHINYNFFKRGGFMPKEAIPSTSPPVIQENIIPVLSTPALARKGFSVYIKSIVSSKQAKANGFVDFVPMLMSSSQLRISSNRSKLHYATLDRCSPFKWSVYAFDDMKLHGINSSQFLIAHHRPRTLIKLLRNYASYERRGILTFVLLSEHFLVYHMP